MLNTPSITDMTMHLPQATGSGHMVVGAQGETIAPDTLDCLEQLDDTVFAVLEGDANALDQLAVRWQDALERVESSLVNESKQEYVRQAQSAWKRSVRTPESRLTEGFAALELLELFDDDAA